MEKRANVALKSKLYLSDDKYQIAIDLPRDIPQEEIEQLIEHATCEDPKEGIYVCTDTPAHNEDKNPGCNKQIRMYNNTLIQHCHLHLHKAFAHKCGKCGNHTCFLCILCRKVYTVTYKARHAKSKKHVSMLNSVCPAVKK